MARTNPSRKCKTSDVRETLQKMNYALVGETSAVQICRWTKNSINGDRGCWKEIFYGVKTNGCCQMTPAVMWCENQCLHCWRPIEMNLGTTLPKIDDPIEILDGIVEARKKLLIGFRGSKNADLKKLEEGLEPSLYTMSLSGEPTLYPRIGEMFKEIRKRNAVSFLVTNGLNPDVIKNFKDDEFPTQITVSTNAPNESLFKIWHRSTKSNAWEIFNETLDVIKSLKGKVRRVIRLTLVDIGEEGEFNETTNMSEENVKEYCDLIRKAEPDFVHVKGYKSVGYARARMGYDNQPWFEAVKDYAEKMQKELLSDGYKIGAEDERCCVVMLAKDGAKLKIDKV
ncbi:radical SAM protein [Candidatus Pacearchaeota archaeon]|nr:radical SAM protein [Candidatus Pacearchaeota archaeon]